MLNKHSLFIRDFLSKGNIPIFVRDKLGHKDDINKGKKTNECKKQDKMLEAKKKTTSIYP